METLKTFTYQGRAFALVRGARGSVDLATQDNSGSYYAIDGTTRIAREAWAYALKKWPEYTEARHG
jgi:hypothetical protein